MSDSQEVILRSTSKADDMGLQALADVSVEECNRAGALLGREGLPVIDETALAEARHVEVLREELVRPRGIALFKRRANLLDESLHKCAHRSAGPDGCRGRAEKNDD